MDEELSLESRLSLEDGRTALDLPDDKKIISQKKGVENADSQSVLDQARAEAQKIKDNAKALYATVEQKIEDAKKQGFEKGHKEGLQKATEHIVLAEKKLEKLSQTLEKDSVELVYEIAKQIIGEAFETDSKNLISLIKQGLTRIIGDELVVSVHPDDYDKIKEQKASLLSTLHGMQRLTLKPSENVNLNSCIIESEMGTIEADLNSQLQAMKKALEIKDENHEL